MRNEIIEEFLRDCSLSRKFIDQDFAQKFWCSALWHKNIKYKWDYYDYVFWEFRKLNEPYMACLELDDKTGFAFWREAKDFGEWSFYFYQNWFLYRIASYDCPPRTDPWNIVWKYYSFFWWPYTLEYILENFKDMKPQKKYCFFFHYPTKEENKYNYIPIIY